jgi:hypothetical protein
MAAGEGRKNLEARAAAEAITRSAFTKMTGIPARLESAAMVVSLALITTVVAVVRAAAITAAAVEEAVEVIRTVLARGAVAAHRTSRQLPTVWAIAQARRPQAMAKSSSFGTNRGATQKPSLPRATLTSPTFCASCAAVIVALFTLGSVWWQINIANQELKAVKKDFTLSQSRFDLAQKAV